VIRYIYCYPCGERALDRLDDLPKVPGEGQVTQGGQCRDEYRCDACNVRLLPGDLAMAVTLHTGDYHPWELRYLRPLGEAHGR